MPDISMCKGGSCPLRINCYRYTAKAEELGQTYFKDPPYKMSMITDENHGYVGVVTTTCAYFWNNDQYEDEKPKN
jgi:hypothetical protein